MTIRIGLLGSSGRWGSRYVQTFERLKLPDVELICFPRGSDFLKRTLSGLIIATPPETHFSYALSAIAANLAVLVEKPATLTVQEAIDLVTRAEQKHARVMVGHQHLYAPGYLGLWKKSKNREIVSIKSIGCGPGPARDYSALWDWGCHDLAMIFGLLGITKSHSWKVVESYVAKRAGGSAWRFKLMIGNCLADVTCGNIFKEKIRRFSVITSDPIHYVYEDAVGKPKLTVDDVPQTVSDTLPLDLEIKKFESMCHDWSIQDTNDLHLAYQIADVLTHVEYKAREKPEAFADLLQ